MPEGDVGAALGELERKLKSLEDELHGVTRDAHAPAPPPVRAPAPTPTPARPPAPPQPVVASAPAPSPPGGLDELAGFQEELERAGSAFLAAYERVLQALRSATDAARGPAVPAAPVAPPPPAVAAAPAPWATTPAPWDTAAPVAQPSPVGPGGLDDTVLEGTISVDAGPFTDIATLSGFEQALRGVPGVRDVQVRGFEGSCAFLDVVLERPVALGAALRRTAPVPFGLTQAGPSRLSIAVEPRV